MMTAAATSSHNVSIYAGCGFPGTIAIDISCLCIPVGEGEAPGRGRKNGRGGIILASGRLLSSAEQNEPKAVVKVGVLVV
jgi:hypothetical protein